MTGKNANTQDAALAALDAGLAAADAMSAGTEPEILSLPAAEPETEETVEPTTETSTETAEPNPDDVTPPADGVEPAATPEAEDTAEDAEAKAAAADAEEAKGLGFKNQKGVEAYQRIKASERALTVERDTLRQQVQDFQPRAEAFTRFRTHMDEIGTTPEQFGLATTIIQVVNDPNAPPKMLEAVAAELQNQLNIVQGKLGLAPSDGRELYETDPELAQEVSDGVLTVARANELARARKLAGAENAHATATANAQRERTEREAAANAERETQIKQAVQDLDDLGARLAKIEPEAYAAKQAAALEQFRKQMGSVAPHRWESLFRKIYDDIPYTPKAKVATASTVPLRSTGGPVGGTKVASTPLDALNAGLEAAARGQTW